MSPSSPSEKGKDEKSKPKENPEENKKWAIPVNISAPCDDFYKRIPNPAFKVGILVIIQLKNMILCQFVPLCMYAIFKISPPYLFVVSMFLYMWWITDPVSLPSSAPVAVWSGRFPETGCAEAGGSRLCVCSRTHISWQNSGGRVRHRSLTETHDKVCICWYKSISSTLAVCVGAQLCRKLNTLSKSWRQQFVFEVFTGSSSETVTNCY